VHKLSTCCVSCDHLCIVSVFQFPLNDDILVRVFFFVYFGFCFTPRPHKFVVIVSTTIVFVVFVCVYIFLSQFWRFAHLNTFVCVCVRCCISFCLAARSHKQIVFVFLLSCLELHLSASRSIYVRNFCLFGLLLICLNPVGNMSWCKKKCTIKCADDSEQPRFIYYWLWENIMHAKCAGRECDKIIAVSKKECGAVKWSCLVCIDKQIDFSKIYNSVRNQFSKLNKNGLAFFEWFWL